jgi:hypothetical protein
MREVTGQSIGNLSGHHRRIRLQGSTGPEMPIMLVSVLSSRPAPPSTRGLLHWEHSDTLCTGHLRTLIVPYQHATERPQMNSGYMDVLKISEFPELMWCPQPFLAVTRMTTFCPVVSARSLSKFNLNSNQEGLQGYQRGSLRTDQLIRSPRPVPPSWPINLLCGFGHEVTLALFVSSCAAQDRPDGTSRSPGGGRGWVWSTGLEAGLMFVGSLCTTLPADSRPRFCRLPCLAPFPWLPWKDESGKPSSAGRRVAVAPSLFCSHRELSAGSLAQEPQAGPPTASPHRSAPSSPRVTSDTMGGLTVSARLIFQCESLPKRSQLYNKVRGRHS